MGNFDTKDVVSATTLLVLVYLLVYNGSNTNKVIQALGTTYDGAVATLQGRTAGTAAPTG